MSTTIDYRREAFTMTDPKFNDQKVLVLTEMGASNCFDSNNRRARNWQIFAFNSAYSVYGQVAEYAGSASGGMLTMNSMSRRECSDYAGAIYKVIRAYDKAIKAAAPIEKVFESFMISADLQIKGEPEKRDKEQIEEFLKTHALTPRYEQYYGETIQRAGLCVNDIETLSSIHALRNKKAISVIYRISKKGDI